MSRLYSKWRWLTVLHMKYEAPDEVIADNVQRAIHDAGLTERSVSVAAGIPDATWDRIIRKRVGSLRLSQLTRIAEALEVDVRGLMPAPVIAA